MALRQLWSSRTTFLLAAIGSAVGLGNLWRFPFIAYENGGGAFLVPYFVALLTTGIPLLMAEYAFGARSKTGAPHAMRKISPRVEWVGWWAILTGFVIMTYYLAVMAWSWFYLVKSPSIPWSGDASAYFYSNVLQISEGPMQLGGLVWPLVFGALLTWILCYFITRWGTKSVGAVVKWTVPLPYILLIILLVHGLMRVGSAEGILYYLTPTWDVLTNPSVWMAAYGQVFFSLSLGFGVMIAYASYVKEKEDLPWQATFAGLANSATEFFAGFVVFAVLGALAAVTNVSVSEVVAGGPGLAFVAFPTALAALPFAKFFSFAFFLMLLTLGIDSAFSLLEAAVTAIQDRFPKWKRGRILFWLCLVGFLLGLLFVTNAGLYWLDIVDHWMNSYGLVGVGLAEALILTFLLGTKKLKSELNEHTIRPVGLIWELSIWFITPIALTVTIILSLKGEFTNAYGGYPPLALAIGGWGVWATTIILALLFQKDKMKWLKLLGFLLIVAVILVGMFVSPAAAMGLFGSLVLIGGLLWLIIIDWMKRNKLMPKAVKK
ncbi:sodium-dependent transporter [Patescibacteria group bacterium]|nr:sodium-dependent transporter [Patescibacteria group bacterium]MBU1935450.1 sodium-dependent transporter [Patescibacteria group bacterium]